MGLVELLVLCNFGHKLGYMVLILGAGRGGNQLSKEPEVINTELWVHWEWSAILDGDFQEAEFEHRPIVLILVPKSL